MLPAVNPLLQMVRQRSSSAAIARLSRRTVRPARKLMPGPARGFPRLSAPHSAVLAQNHVPMAALQGRGPLAALLPVILLLACCGGLSVAAAVSIDTPEQLFAALSGAAEPGAPQATELELRSDVVLSPAAAAGYTLPFVIPANHTLTLRGEPPSARRKLSFGQIDGLLYFKAGSTLTLLDLNISGDADPQLGSWPNNTRSPNIIQSLPLWPTMWADPEFTMRVFSSHWDTHPSLVCTPEVFAAQVAGLRALASAAGLPSDVGVEGTTAYPRNWTAPMPVFSVDTKAAIGTVTCSSVNTTVTCTLAGSSDATSAAGSEPSSGDASGAGSGQGSNGGTPGWVWGIIGGTAGAVVAVAAAALLLMRRRKRIQQQQAPGKDGSKTLCSSLGSSINARQTPPMLSPFDRPHHSGSSSGQGTASDGLDTMTVTTSGMLNQLAAAPSGVPEGLWRSRMGFAEGLQLGALIGRGGYARVYRGRWKGSAVAVKVVETCVGPHQQYDLRSEPVLSLSLSHPNVLQGYKMCAVRLLTDGEAVQAVSDAAASQPDGLVHSGGNHLARSRSCEHSSSGSRGPLASGSCSGGRLVPHLTNPGCFVEVMPTDAVLQPGMYEMWLVSELADKGNLLDALKAGWLSDGEAAAPCMSLVLPCLLDIARGLEYLHSCSIVHGDLKPQNVMLKTAAADRRGFVCKLGDFGLSRMLRETETHVNTGSYGTVTHAAPELLTEGRLTKSSDVFAFGMLLWELVVGQRMFRDMNPLQIIVQVTQRGYRPPITPGFPGPLASLAQQCWAQDPHDRPTAAAVVEYLINFSAANNAHSNSFSG